MLMPFAEGKPSSLDQWANKNWLVLPDGSVQVKRGDNKSIKQFGSFQAHVEFWVPWMPSDRGQGGAIAAFISTAATRSRSWTRSA